MKNLISHIFIYLISHIFIFCVIVSFGAAFFITIHDFRKLENNRLKVIATQTLPHRIYEVFIIENCEYIKTPNTYGYSLTHKGNCTNHIHVYSK